MRLSRGLRHRVLLPESFTWFRLFQICTFGALVPWGFRTESLPCDPIDCPSNSKVEGEGRQEGGSFNLARHLPAGPDFLFELVAFPVSEGSLRGDCGGDAEAWISVVVAESSAELCGWLSRLKYSLTA